MRGVKSFTLVALAALFLPCAVAAQTATTGTIVGAVSDPQAAAVAGAKIELLNTATNESREQTTSAAGQYTFPNVPPGVYKVTATMQGFRTATVSDFKVDVAKSYTVDIKLELGQTTEVVHVEASNVVRDLQTTNATVGNVISGQLMPRMPALSRQVNELLSLQPLATPTGEVAGARSDQSTFTLDGIDVTNQVVGGTGTFIFLPIDGVEEFRVAVANPDALFGRGAGGQVAVISKGGTATYHGKAFWYHQNDNLNANTWTNNRTRIKKPELKDNRFGGNFGGPFPWLENKTFFFAHYEGRRFPRNTPFVRHVPSDTLRQGLLRFRDASGNLMSFNLATAMNCGPAQSEPCDPRGLGLSPTIAALWRMLPPGNDPSTGDGLNTVGFRANAPTPINHNYYNLRVDHNVSRNWRADVAFRYLGELPVGAANPTGTNFPLQILNADVQSRGKNPNRQNMVRAGLRGSLSPRLTSEFSFGWVRSRTSTDRFRPNQSAALLAVPGTSTPDGHIALDLGARSGLASLLDEPIDVDTQVARKQITDQRTFQWNADFAWVRSSHTFQFGTRLRYLPMRHLRDDKVLGALGALVAQIDGETAGINVLPDTQRPRACSMLITTDCLPAAEATRWGRLYTAVTGMIDNVSVLLARDGNFNPRPFGELLEADTKSWAPEFYFQDIWRMTPTFTLVYGVNYGWQTPPTERLGRQTFQINRATGEFLSSRDYFAVRAQEARLGRIFNPDFAFLPINSSGRSEIFNTDWNNIAPRVALAWSPGFSNGLLGTLFGNRKTVLRGGYSLVFDRINTVQSVIIPTLGVAFGQTINITAPACNATGGGGMACDAMSTNPTIRGFRVGVDGTIPRPTIPSQSIPVAPFWGITPGTPGPPFPPASLRLFPEILSFQVDPKMEVAENHALDITWQREVPGNMLVEAGYIGRFARKLPQSMNFGQAPYLHVDPASGQSFAQAFDALAAQVRAGVPSASLTTQPWFENNTPAGACVVSGLPVTCTRWLAATSAGNLSFGRINNLFLSIDRERMLNGVPPFVNYMSQTLFLRSSTGRSNYNALFVTAHKRMSRGLLFTANYTFSRSLDQIGAIQNAASVMPSNFDLNVEYGPSGFDFTHVFNTSWLYELPFGRGRFFNLSHGFLDRIAGGWYTSGIMTARSADPLILVQDSQIWGGTLFLGFASGMVPTVDPNTFGNGLRQGVAGSGGIGTTGNPNVCTPICGTGLSLFQDPAAVFNSFRHVRLSSDLRSGRSRPIRGLPQWNADLAIGKKTRVNEQLMVVFSLDFFNMFNHVNFSNPSLSLANRPAFGVITSQFIPANRSEGSRWIQFGLRVEF